MRKWLIVLMAAVAIGATGILGWLYMRQDRKGPEITIAESKKNSYTSDMTTEDLLEGVKAVDKRDGEYISKRSAAGALSADGSGILHGAFCFQGDVL